MPYELKERDIEKRKTTYEILLRSESGLLQAAFYNMGCKVRGLPMKKLFFACEIVFIP